MKAARILPTSNLQAGIAVHETALRTYRGGHIALRLRGGNKSEAADLMNGFLWQLTPTRRGTEARGYVILWPCACDRNPRHE
jgi:hypothetical protein